MYCFVSLTIRSNKLFKRDSSQVSNFTETGYAFIDKSITLDPNSSQKRRKSAKNLKYNYLNQKRQTYQILMMELLINYRLKFQKSNRN